MKQLGEKIYCIFDSTSFCHIYYSFLISTPHIFSAQSHVNSREKKNHLEKDYAETAATAEMKIVSSDQNVSTILQFTISKVLSQICRKTKFLLSLSRIQYTLQRTEKILIYKEGLNIFVACSCFYIVSYG